MRASVPRPLRGARSKEATAALAGVPLGHHDGVTGLLAGESYARRRTTVEAFLRERSVELADLYRWAGALLEDRRPDGWPHMVAHVGRELMNRLADYLAGVPLEDSSGPPAPTRPEEISRRLSDALAGDDHTLRAATQGLVEAIARAGEATEQRAAAFVVRAEAGEDLDEGSTAAWARAWRILQRRFASWAHLRGPASADVSEVELERGMAGADRSARDEGGSRTFLRFHG